MSPPLLQLNSLVEKQEGNCALGQGKYPWLGSAHPGVFTQPLPSYSPFRQHSGFCEPSPPTASSKVLG